MAERLRPINCKAMENKVKVGDILAGTWGYSMVIPCFYMVTKVTPKGVKMYELEKTRSGMQGYEEPVFPHRPKDGECKEVYAKPCEKWDGYWKTGGRYDHRYLTKWNGRKIWADYMD